MAWQLPANSLARTASICSRGLRYLPILCRARTCPGGFRLVKYGKSRTGEKWLFLISEEAPQAPSSAHPRPCRHDKSPQESQAQCLLPKANVAPGCQDGPSLGLGTEFSPWWDGTLSFPPPIPNLLPKQDQKCTGSSLSVAVWECCLFPGSPGSSVLTAGWGLPERTQPQLSDRLAQPGENFVASLTASLKDDVFCLLESHRVWPRPGSFEFLIFISAGLMCLTGVRQVRWDPAPVQLTQWGAGCLHSLCLLPDSSPHSLPWSEQLLSFQ